MFWIPLCVGPWEIPLVATDEFPCHTNNLFYNDNILKLEDIIKLEQMKLIFEYKSNCLPLDLKYLLQENKDINV